MTPTRRQFSPWPYQLKIIHHILRYKKCAIWAGMGMGKTASTLTTIDMLGLSGDLKGPVLVIAPLRVARSTWPKEVEKWAHLRDMRIRPILGTEADRKYALRDSAASVFTINYDNIPWLVEHFDNGHDWPFTMVVADESTRLKNFRGGLRKHPKTGKTYLQGGGGLRSRALARVVALGKIERFVELTGTPSPNGLQDLWGQIWFLDVGRRLGGNFKAFSHRWFQQSFDGYSITPLPAAQKQIEEAVKDLCLSLNPKDYFDVADPVIRPVYVDLPEKARKKYREMEKEMFIELMQDGIEHKVEAFNAATRTLKCLQLASGAAYIPKAKNDLGRPTGPQEWIEVHDEKIEALKSIVEEAAGMPVLVAYHFKSDLARLKKAFPKGCELDKDPKTEDAWNAGKIPVLFAHPASAGHGLNLQDGGNILVLFTQDWDLELYQQILERIGPTRQLQAGHNRPVFIYPIIARSTMDEVVMKRRESKREVQDLLLEAMKNRESE